VRIGGIGQKGDKLANFWSSRKIEQILGYPKILRTAWRHGACRQAPPQR